MAIKFNLKIKEPARLCAKKVKDFVHKDTTDEDFLDKLIEEEKNGANIKRVDGPSDTNNR